MRSAAEALPPVPRQPAAIVAAAGTLAAGVLWLGLSAPRAALLLVIGAALGVTLYHSAFGFASAYRRWIVTGEAGAIRAQLLMLALATALFAPMLAAGDVLGQPVGGFVAPLGLNLAIGAFVFGIGMQLAGGCGSGTLYTVGGGNARMAIVLAAFIAGSFVGSLHLPWWERLPGLPAVALGERLGPAGVLLQLGAIAALAWALRRHPIPHSAFALFSGPWPILGGAVALAGLNAVTLAVAGQPWGITWAFALWGAKLARLAGWDPAGSAWADGGARAALDTALTDDITSIMDAGLMLGAALAAALAGRFSPRLAIPARSALAAVIGGLAMGYGARLAYGCNVGAFFSGVASTSLHGWAWIAAALPGCWVGVRLRPLFGLAN